MADIIHGVLFAYPAFTEFILALIILALLLRVMRWLDDEPVATSAIEGLHSAPDNLEIRARRVL